MVLKKTTYHGGFHGLLSPVIPKAPRSLRKRSLHKKPSEVGEICAFELLANVADKLSQEHESESSSSSTGSKQYGQITVPQCIKKEPLEVEVKVKPTFQNSQNDSVVTNAGFEKEVNTNLIMEAMEDKSGLEDLLEPCVNNRAANKATSTVNLSFYHSPFHGSCFPVRRNMNVNIRDDDEKYFRYSDRRLRAFGYRRMRKMMRSRYWKVARNLKHYERPNFTGGVKSYYHKRKHIHMREQFQTDGMFKRRKLFHQRSGNSQIKKSNLVKFSIKSFKVPELYIEVPETSTVGSLKRSVMEAVTAILHGKLHVGVIVQGKAVRDDNRTLQQSGISRNCNLESLGFMLEPSLPEASSFLVPQETPSCNLQQQELSSLDIDVLVTSMEDHVEKNEVGTTLAAEGTTKEAVEDTKALVVPQRYECSSSQRRRRRPFSVSEVEALVEAVETLGAGRWRDVKMRAFNDADHRTYVDLKDKWKTLVHTASISPQQRRGETVPQDVLDRVLAAHAYWSQHQHVKKHQKTLEAQM